jgi:hypothetical protein
MIFFAINLRNAEAASAAGRLHVTLIEQDVSTNPAEFPCNSI